jgi:hypothetical protein
MLLKFVADAVKSYTWESGIIKDAKLQELTFVFHVITKLALILNQRKKLNFLVTIYQKHPLFPSVDLEQIEDSRK